MSDERKGRGFGEEELLGWLDKCWSLSRTSQGEYEKVKEVYEQIRKIIHHYFNQLLDKHYVQQKPKVDDMEKYVEEKAIELGQQNYLGDEVKDFIRQIISDVKGREDKWKQ